MNELIIPVTITSPTHKPMLVYTKFLDFSHWPGDANVTGIPTTKIIDKITSSKTNNCTRSTMILFPIIICYLNIYYTL